jgi:SAM-dependent methyltransferase
MERLTTRARWDAWHAAAGPDGVHWRPRSPDDTALAARLLHSAPAHAHRILEVGCGGSRMLPWLAARLGAQAAGIDYSPAGCASAEAKLRIAGVPGNIILADILERPAVEPADLVYSLGVVEHFTDPWPVLEAMRRLLRPCGVLVTAIPNLTGLHGALTRWWQPAVFAEHRVWEPAALAAVHRRAGLSVRSAGYAGSRSLDIVAWEQRPRWPWAARRLSPLTRRLPGLGARWARVCHDPNRWASPFVVIVSTAPPCA